MKVLTFTGWQQPSDALASIAPGARHFDYSRFDNLEDCFECIPDADVAIGWSLGGRIAIDGIARGVFRPKYLILLASKYQCMSDDHFPHGMSRDLMEATKKAFRNDPEGMLKQFQFLVARGDADERRVAKELTSPLPAIWPHAMFWLEYLEKFSCRNVDFSHFPRTMILHGTEDYITTAAHAEMLHGAISGSELRILERAGHSLHNHDKEKVINIVNQFINIKF